MGMTVPTKLTVFGVDCCTDEFLPHPGCCALSLSCHQILFAESADTNTTTTTSSSSSSNTHLLTISKGGGNSSSSVCLFVHVSADINDDSHIIVPEWALSVLKVTHGTMSVLVEPVFPVIEDTDNITEVRFVFKAYQSYRHWDNVATSTPFSIPGSWSCGWPELSKQVVQKMLPVLLHSRRFLIDRSLLVVDILDVGMMFHVQFIGNNNEDMSVRRIIQIAPLLSKKLTVVIPNTEMKVNDVIVDNSPEYQPSYYCLHGFFSTIYRRITSICNAAVLRRPNSSEDSWKGVRSMLISASEGAGKSSLLLEIQKGLQAAVKIAGQEESPGVQIVCLSGKGIELRYDRSVPLLSNTNQEDTKPSSPFQSTSARRRMKIRENLQILMQLLQPQEVQNGGYPTSISTTTASTTTPLRVIVVIDDLDQILAANGGTSLEDEAAGDAARRGTVCLRAAYHLRQLLHDLSIQQSHDISSCTNENDQIVVIGATRMAINLLPRSHQGAPEFELTLNLTRPARFDREQLIFNMLEGMQTQWVLEELEDDTSDGGHISVLKPEKSSNMRIWASRMAGLTAGYLPGDLGQVMRRAINTYLGQMSMANVSETTTTSKNTAEKLQTKPCLSWRSMLAVIASQPPRQLQQLSSIVAGVGGSDGARTNLTWDDFAGYDDVKQSLQRLINSSKISHTRLKSSQQTVCDQHDEKNSSHSTTAIDSNQLTLRGYLKITTSSMRGIVFHGQPGCGKSFLARIVAAEAKMNFVSVRSTELLSKYFGQTEASIRSVFKQARAAAPCVVFFDEFDALAYKRGMSDSSAGDGGGTGSLQTRILSTFLNELDGVLSQHHCEGDGEDGIIVLAACNNIDILDEALLRPGRLQHHIRLELPNRDDIAAMLRLHTRSLRCGDDVSIDTLADTLAKQMRHVTGAHVESLCRRAIIMRIREEAKKNGIQQIEEKDSIPSISMDNFLQALDEMYPQTTPSPSLPPLPAFEWNSKANFIF